MLTTVLNVDEATVEVGGSVENTNWEAAPATTLKELLVAAEIAGTAGAAVALSL
jgi:hypothetical protein